MELLEIPFTGPVLPATIAVGLALFWSLMSTVGAFGAEGWPGHHTELDVDAGIDVPLEVGWN